MVYGIAAAIHARAYLYFYVQADVVSTCTALNYAYTHTYAQIIYTYRILKCNMCVLTCADRSWLTSVSNSSKQVATATTAATRSSTAAATAVPSAAVT
jgi:hypothetical protein